MSVVIVNAFGLAADAFQMAWLDLMTRPVPVGVVATG